MDLLKRLRTNNTAIRSSSSGDTIIEVLLAIAIVSMVLAGAYVSSGNSLSVVRNTQEREEALKIAEGQLETLRQAVEDGDTSVFNVPSELFCFDGNTKVGFGASPSTLPDLESDNFGSYPTECQNVNQFYNISIEYDEVSDEFTSSARWDNRLGDRSQVQLIYRVYQGSF